MRAMGVIRPTRKSINHNASKKEALLEQVYGQKGGGITGNAE